MKNTVISFVLLIGCLFSFVGCSSKKSGPSGFLGDQSVYNSMKANPNYDGVMEWKAPGADLSKYNAFIVEPVRIYLSEEGQGRDLSQEELDGLADYFRTQVVKALGPAYPAIRGPIGEDVGILRIAITDADPNVTALNIHPGTVITGGGLGGATFEAELVDSVTRERVIAVWESSKGSRYKYSRGYGKWGHTRGLFDDWSARIRRRLDKAHGVS